MRQMHPHLSRSALAGHHHGRQRPTPVTKSTLVQCSLKRRRSGGVDVEGLKYLQNCLFINLLKLTRLIDVFSSNPIGVRKLTQHVVHGDIVPGTPGTREADPPHKVVA
jgi:hypothetical protein